MTTQSAMERIGHRGAPREFPENTLAAFERALELGADALELDVHATADGVVVVHHDPVLGEESAGVWRGREIDTLTWAELQGVEISPGITIPSIAQVLDLVGSRAMVYVEIKGRDIHALVAEALRDSPASCAVHSFDHDTIARMARIAPSIPRGLLFEEPADVVAALMAARARDAWPHWPLVDRALVDAVHAMGGRVIAWTVNARAEAERLASLGVDGICTDDLRLLRDVPV
jgi:glycerophosphoryl diester phosphodiesterase